MIFLSVFVLGRSDMQFWFDKVCLDQNAINDSLKALPVYLTSCNAMLVVAGSTYINRLWW